MLDQINSFLQRELENRSMDEVSVVEAAQWLSNAFVLKDDPDFPGRNLRQLCREGKIDGAVDRSRFWVVQRKVEGTFLD